MNFVSLPFLIFFAIVICLYYLLPHKLRYILLLVASYFFYAYFNMYLALLLLAVTAVSYVTGLLLSKSKNKRQKKLWLALSSVLCIGTLLFFKYFNFLTSSAISLCNLIGAELSPFSLNILLPIGISFYTFQTLSYIIEVYRGSIVPEKHFGYYALFVSYFPQLVAGPIERPQNLLPQLKTEHPFNLTLFKEGLFLTISGYVKKVVIADSIAQFVNVVYNSQDLSSLTGLAVLVSTSLFYIQIYCDFSGYSDIAIGLSKMMGIELMQNFNKPLLSQSVTDFWSRWHISLSAWFKDYVYMPLAYTAMRKKNFTVNHCFITMLIMLLCGIWHGANMTYVVWGLVIGVYQIVETLLRKPIDRLYQKRNANRNATWRIVLRRIGTFVLIMLSMVFFRANSLADAWVLFGKLFSQWSFSQQYFDRFLAQTTLSLPYGAIIVLCVVLLMLIDDVVSIPRGKNTLLTTRQTVWNNSFVSLAWLVLLAYCMLMAANGQENFLYFQF